MAELKSKVKEIKEKLLSKTEKEASPAQSSSDEYITLQLHELLTPAFILLSGMLISFTIFFSIKAIFAPDVLGAKTNAQFAKATTNIDDDPILGNKKKAKLAIVEFSDFECPYCHKHFNESHAKLLEKYIKTNKVFFVYRDLPLTSHPLAQPAALAGNCVRAQKGDEGFYKYHDLVFSESLASEEQISNYAKKAGVNMDKYNDCMESEKYAKEIQNDIEDANSAGIGATPSFIIGELQKDGTVEGVRVPGAYPYNELEALIDSML
ncbi:MAG: hypothetical protein Fur003_1820 [Candidatus Dojkabacteria bacterium]